MGKNAENGRKQPGKQASKAKTPAAAVPARVEPAPVPQDTTPFLGRWDWLAFWIATLVSFAVYYYTLAPTVTLEDSGELAVAGDYLGIPHPPGYPLWTIIVWLFTEVFSFKRTPPMFTQPNPAWSIGLASAVAGALAAGITAMLICRSGRDMLRSIRTKGANGDLSENLICFAGGIAGSLLFGFSPVMWSQSVIVEVYSLNAFFVALILMLAYAWLCRPSDKHLYVTALVFGLGLGNWWPSVLLTMGPLALIIMLKDLKLFRDFAAVGIIVFGMIGFNMVLYKMGSSVDEVTGQPLHPWAAQNQWMLWTASGPYNKPFWVYFAINVAALVAAWFFLPRGKVVARTFLLVEVGLLIYLYMPIASDVNNPPMNWGYPRTWEGFLHAVSRGQYEKITPMDMFSKKFVDGVGAYMTELRCQFTLPLALLGFLPFAGWSLSAGKKRVSGLLPALILAALVIGLIVMEEVVDVGAVSIGEMRAYIPLVAGILGLLVLGSAAMILTEAEELIGKLREKIGVGIVEKTIIALVFLGGMALLLIYEAHLASKLVNAAKLGLSGVAKIAILVMIAGPVALLGGVAWLMFGRFQMRFDISRDSQKWVIATVFCFLLMSVGMVIGANPTGDIQDMFIQRVKFITSHELYAFWIGYGLVLGFGYIDNVLRGNSPLTWLGCLVAALLPVYPVLENAPFLENQLNREYLRVYGGTSMRNHDFGWQFGNYQLRGIEAILEELKPGEEPPPSKTYPPPMGPNAVFFGGTDPGRFVPTYMIYSAVVRPDVFLITQNALADNTYMSVMRDLYGEEIWIPSVADNNEAFRIYHEDVKAGRRPGNIDVRSGRLIVTGVEHVMAINGILCKMIHDFNKWKHDFYVEESYVISWMYPYMEPHGLILKVNREELPGLTEEMIKNDMEFWAWYTRRLLGDKNFIYDAVARKTFSKLRSAIAGLYEYRDIRDKAEQAYNEAIKLCPTSPEASFRLAAMYMRYGRLDEAKGVLERFAKEDPNNTRIADMIKDIDARKGLFRRKDELEQIIAGGKVQLNTVFELADVYRSLGNNGAFRSILQNMLQNQDLPLDAYLTAGKMFCDVKMYDDMAAALKRFMGKAPPDTPPDRFKRVAELYAGGSLLADACTALHIYLARAPVDVQAWHELGVMYTYQNKHEEAVKALYQAIRLGGNTARDDVRRDSRLAPFLNRPEYARLLSMP